MTLVFITTVLWSSTLKPFADYIGIGKDDNEGNEGNNLRLKMMGDDNNSKSEASVSNYHHIGLAFESS